MAMARRSRILTSASAWLLVLWQWPALHSNFTVTGGTMLLGAGIWATYVFISTGKPYEQEK